MAAGGSGRKGGRGNVAALPLSSVCVGAAAQQPPVAAGAVAAAPVVTIGVGPRAQSPFNLPSGFPIMVGGPLRARPRVSKELNLGVAYSSKAITETINYFLSSHGLPTGAGTS